MLVVGILLIVLGAIGVLLGGMMFGDIGVAAIVGAITAILSGIGFILCNRSLKNQKKDG